MPVEQAIAALARHPGIELAIVFGSAVRGEVRRDSDLDIAIRKGAPLNASEKMQLIAELAAATGRPVDLIDLHTVGEPLLGQILKHGKMIRGDTAGMAELMQQHVYAMEDFVPYVERTLAERRHAWIG